MNNIKLVPVERKRDHMWLLYDLLVDRDDNVNISHRKLPTYLEHSDFVRSNPYKKWFIIHYNMIDIGSIYITHKNEIGIFILKQFRGKGIGKESVKHLMEYMKDNTSFLANINPKNERSIKLFESLGFKHIQNTYRLEK